MSASHTPELKDGFEDPHICTAFHNFADLIGNFLFGQSSFHIAFEISTVDIYKVFRHGARAAGYGSFTSHDQRREEKTVCAEENGEITVVQI